MVITTKPVSTGSLTGAQVDATYGRLDARAQFTNSSAANRRSIFDSDQYPNWSGGAGYTVRQGLRINVSAYRRPYLHRSYTFYVPGEANPRDLPAAVYGIDGQWARGPWSAYGELQRLKMTYSQGAHVPAAHRICGGTESAAPPLVCGRTSGVSADQPVSGPGSLRDGGRAPAERFQLLEIGYQIQSGHTPNTPAVRLVTSFKAFSIARD